jgi:hypothetical protein
MPLSSSDFWPILNASMKQLDTLLDALKALRPFIDSDGVRDALDRQIELAEKQIVELRIG